jgi:hypothetical protein
MNCGCTGACTCGCCAGTTVVTPIAEYNAPSLPAIAYRTGTWATFKESMLARLSSSDYPALTRLTTRADDDFSIALLDASAVVLDILTFYQERLANESYLRTATQLYSLTQLSKLIGYQPSPGVSASVYLAFTLSSTPGLPPNPMTTAITIPAGTTVQSVPAQGQTPQAFQTSAAILAKPDWNALAVQTGNPWLPAKGDTYVYLQGTATQLSPGDSILIVGNERAGISGTTPPTPSVPSNPNWDIRIVSSVTSDTVNQRTLITWSSPLTGQQNHGPAEDNPLVYAFRQRAALFGYNAVNPMMLAKHTVEELNSADLLTTSGKITDWNFDATGDTLAGDSLVDLDNVYNKITSGGSTSLPTAWIALSYTDPSSGEASQNLFAIEAVSTISRSGYGVSGKITRVLTDSDSSTEAGLTADYRNTRLVAALAQSELLPTAEKPLDYPLYGTLIDLETVRDDLPAIQAVAVTGRNPILIVNPGATVTFTPYDSSGQVTLIAGAALTLLQPPPTPFDPSDGTIVDWAMLTTEIPMVVADPNGRPGTAQVVPSNVTVAPAPSNAPIVQEVALVSLVSQVSATQTATTTPATPARTRIVVTSPLLNCYDRYSTTVNANVGAATGGGPVSELLGSGAAATPNQTFKLKQSPLTYTQAPTSTGSASSLQVQVNGAAWALVPTLYNQPPTAQVFTVANPSSGGAQVIFGDGVEGSTVPTGQNNIIANYRVGTGSAGNVGAGAISTLVDRPVGVSGVTNPMPATGGQDPQTVAGIQANAPLSVITLGRAVSITDYQIFAATFPGIAKATALWIPNGYYRGVFITVAASNGAALTPPNLTLANLQGALTAYGNPAIAVQIASFWETLFGFEADIAYNPAYSVDAVNTAVMALLNSTYGFANRSFGQGVSGDELAALIQGVAGVVAVNVTHVKVVATSSAGDLGSAGYSVANWQTWIQGHQHLKRPRSGSASAICPYIPVPQLKKLPDPAEILVISPNPADVTLGVMS